ncbi:MAG: hypothetical protein QXK06_05595, partial [Candidatus Diapherotrites archaeon]
YGLREKFRYRNGLLVRRVYERESHIDLFINRVPGMPLLLVDPFYFKDNKALIEEIARHTGHKIIVVPKKERHLYPANFADLGKGKILVNREARKTIRLLEKEGVKVVPTSSALTASAMAGGGPRCTINTPLQTQKRLGIY